MITKTIPDPDYPAMTLGTIIQHQFHWEIVFGTDKALDGYEEFKHDQFDGFDSAKSYLLSKFNIQAN